MDQKMLSILACPICKGKLEYRKKKQEFICRYNKVAYPVRNNIPILLEEEARKLKEEEIAP